MIQYQDWKYSTRILIIDEKNHGSIQVFIPYCDEDKPLDGNADALIYSLWVDKPYRGHGVAKHLMEVAEKELKKCMIKNIAVSWDGNDSPQWVRSWYKRLGYKEKVFGDNCSTFAKQL